MFLCKTTLAFNTPSPPPDIFNKKTPRPPVMFNLTTDFYLHIYKAQCFRLLRAHSFCFVSTKKYEKIREDTQKKLSYL